MDLFLLFLFTWKAITLPWVLFYDYRCMQIAKCCVYWDLLSKMRRGASGSAHRHKHRDTRAHAHTVRYIPDTCCRSCHTWTEWSGTSFRLQGKKKRKKLNIDQAMWLVVRNLRSIRSPLILCCTHWYTSIRLLWTSKRQRICVFWPEAEKSIFLNYFFLNITKISGLWTALAKKMHKKH